MNKKTKALTTEQYTEIIKTMKEGSSSVAAPTSGLLPPLYWKGTWACGLAIFSNSALVILSGMGTDTGWKSPNKKPASGVSLPFPL